MHQLTFLQAMTDTSKLARELVNMVRVVGSKHVVSRREYHSLDLSDPAGLDPTWTSGSAKLIVSTGTTNGQGTLAAWIARQVPKSNRPDEVLTCHVLRVAEDGHVHIYNKKLFTALTACLVSTGKE